MTPPRRRRFEHLFQESCLAVDARLPRYGFWLALHDAGHDPEALDRHDALAFLDEGLPAFLHTHGTALGPRRARSLRRAVARFDASRPTPEEWFGALTER